MPKTITNKKYLIQKSLEVFKENGYYHTTFSELAKACGVEKSHFYYYFKDKKDLMKEVLIYASDYIQNRVFRIAENRDILPKERLIQILTCFKEIYAQSNKGCLMGNTLLETVGREEYFKDVIIRYFDDFRESLELIYREKYPEEAGSRATSALANIQGSVMMTRLYSDGSIFENAVRQLINDF